MILDEDMMVKGYKLTNFATFTFYFLRLKDLATTVFKWKNLPKSINERFLEQALFLYGRVGFAKDDVTGDLIALPMVQNGQFDIYGEPKGIIMFGMNGYQLHADRENSVYCYDNYNKRGIISDVMMFAKRLEIIERTKDINIAAQRTPYVLSGTKSQMAALMKLYTDITENKPVHMIDKSLDLTSVQCLPTLAPFISPDLEIIKKHVWGEALNFIGVDNNATEKKERLVVGEAVGNLGAVKAERYARLKPRQEAVEKVNEMFGTNIEVEINAEVVDEEFGLNKYPIQMQPQSEQQVEKEIAPREEGSK